jgi:hypothetical protein
MLGASIKKVAWPQDPADDYISTFRFGADPKHAWDFAWYFGFIRGGTMLLKERFLSAKSVFNKGKIHTPSS